MRLAADLGYQTQYVGGVIPYLGLNTGVPLPWAPDARKALGQPWGFLQRKDLFGVIRAELDMTERVTAFASFGAHDSRYESLYSQTLTATNGQGQIQGNAIRVSGKSKDELQRVIARLRQEQDSYPVALQFENYR